MVVLCLFVVVLCLFVVVVYLCRCFARHCSNFELFVVVLSLCCCFASLRNCLRFLLPLYKVLQDSLQNIAGNHQIKLKMHVKGSERNKQLTTTTTTTTTWSVHFYFTLALCFSNRKCQQLLQTEALAAIMYKESIALLSLLCLFQTVVLYPQGSKAWFKAQVWILVNVKCLVRSALYSWVAQQASLLSYPWECILSRGVWGS